MTDNLEMPETVDWSRAQHGTFYFGPKLFLDDTRRPVGPNWALAKDYNSFVKYFEVYGCPDIISFDHDLAEEHYVAYASGGYNAPFTEKTGLDCARWCLENNYIPKLVIVHSFNPVGAQNIANVFRGKTRVVVEPYKL